MADSYRLTVMKRLTEHLKGITPANGYDFNLASNVFRGRAVFGENDPVPLVSILEAPRNDVGAFAGGGQARKESWGLLIQGWAKDDKLNPTDPAYALMDAVENHLFRLIEESDSGSGLPKYPAEYRLGKTIAGITISPGVVRPPMENVSSKAFFVLPVQIDLVRPSNT